MKNKRIVAAVSVLLAAASLSAAGKREIASFAIKHGQEIHIAADSSSVSIQSWDKPIMGIFVDRRATADKADILKSISLARSDSAVECAIARSADGARDAFTIVVPETAVVSVRAREIDVASGIISAREMTAERISLGTCRLVAATCIAADTVEIRETRFERGADVRATNASVRDSSLAGVLTITDAGNDSPFSASIRNVKSEGAAAAIRVSPANAARVTIEIREETEKGAASVTVETDIATGSILVRSDHPVNLANRSPLPVTTRDARWESDQPLGDTSGTPAKKGNK